jgi:Tol biopolymer transport system component
MEPSRAVRCNAFACVACLNVSAALLGLTGCTPRVQRGPGAGVERSLQEPALSGDGRLLATVTERRGRPTVQLRDLRSGAALPLRHLSRHQPHSSPSLSWNGRYLAVITQRGQRRLALIEDRLTGRAHPIRLPGDREPVRLSLSPDARTLALQVAVQGRWRLELIDLGAILEPDRSAGERFSGPLQPTP